MKKGSNSNHIHTLVKLFFDLIEEEKNRVELYLQGDLASVETSQARERILVEEVRARLTESRKALPSSGANRDEVSGRDQLRLLREAVAELRSLLQRNNRFLQISMGHSDLLLQALLGGRSRYDGTGVVQSSQGGLKKSGGIRV